MSVLRIEVAGDNVRWWKQRVMADAVLAATVCIGDKKLLSRSVTALLCSVKCPGNAILKTYDLMRAWRDAGRMLISGFHSPMEKECLRILLRGTQPIIICPARSVEGMRIPREWREPIEAGRLLIISPFDKKHRRATKELAQQRNEFIAALADKVFVPYAAPGSKTENLCRAIIASGKTVLTFDTEYNANLRSIGAFDVDQPKS